MIAKQIASDISSLSDSAKEGARVTFGDGWPAPMDGETEIESATAISLSLLLRFKDGALITMLNPTGFCIREHQLLILNCQFLRVESHTTTDPHLFWEYSLESDIIRKSIAGGDLLPHCNLDTPAFSFG